ncbi:class I SAM-dependent methyltransferase [Qipengyuania sp. JC766]|uniref:class I SAM-dependent DNA methyltransferase n=1 Tax=Qipengyuania sp. JC766 TaxID=3232139 RepID=UPI00345B118E
MPDRRRTFDDLFLNDADPWGFESKPYEKAKRAATVEAIAVPPPAHILEIGCANGVLTADLIARGYRVTAIDISAHALTLARARLPNRVEARLIQGEVPYDWPRGIYDLVLISEVLYFLTADEIAEVSRASWGSLLPGSECLLVNWTGPNDLPVDGNRAADLFERAMPWAASMRQTEDLYRIDRLYKSPTGPDR